MRKAALALLFVPTLLAGVAAPAAAAFPTEDKGIPAPGLNCIERVQMPDLLNVIDAKWSPDGTSLAVVRFERKPSGGPAGYIEDEILDVVDLATRKVRSLGVIEYGRPAWSPNGKYLAYWGHKADFLEIMDRKTGEIVAKLTPSNPEFRWTPDDKLVYIEKATIRAWVGSRTPQTLGRLGETKVPHYPEDTWDWSGDGSRFTLTRYDQKAPVPERFVGTTESADAALLEIPAGALYTEWAPRGSLLLVRYPARLELRDFAANTVSAVPIARSALYQWGPDGRTLFARIPQATTAAGGAYEDVQAIWPAAAAGKTAILPDLFGVRTFSPDGRFFSGTVRTDRHDNAYAVFRCFEIVRGDRAAEPVPVAPRFAKIESGTGRLIRPVAGPISQFVHAAHSGVDVAAPFGSPVVATDDGIVTQAGWRDDNEGGLRVCVAHAGGLEDCSYHIAAALVTVGQRVVRGDTIGIVGMSGNTHGPHVHWEAKLNGKIIDPLLR